MTLKNAKLEKLKTAESKDIRESVKFGSSEGLPINMLFDEDKLRTRPGTKPYDKPIFDSARTFDNYERVLFTDCYYYKDNVKGRLIIVVDNDLMSNIKYHFYIAYSNGQSDSAGFIEFTRASYDTFGIPDTFTVYTGKPTRGKGIYFMVRLVYGEGMEDVVRIYELSEDMSEWLYMYSGDFYVPTVLAFGRGENYYRANESEQRIVLSKPVRLEDENLLTNQFIAYYSTDGYSSAFQLPYEDLGDEGISCVYRTVTDEYTFNIPAGAYISEPITIDSKKYRFGCNRSLGTIYFLDSNSASVAFPYLGFENNLKVSACRKISDEMIKLGAMSKCMAFPTGREGNGSKTVVFYGNVLDEGGKLCWINSEKPLYFPKGCSASPGDINNKLLGAYFYRNSLYVFNSEELYQGSVSKADNFDLSLVLKGISPSSKVNYDIISFKGVTLLPQEPISETVAVFDDRILFAGKKGGVYELSLGAALKVKKVADLSYDDFTPTFAVTYKEGYLLANNLKAYYYHPKKECLSAWELLPSIIGGYSFTEETILFAECSCREMSTLIYALHFAGEEDVILNDYFDGEADYHSGHINTKLSCEFDTDTLYNKRLHTVVIDTLPSDKSIKASLIADGEEVYSETVSLETGTAILRYGARFKDLKLKIEGEGITFIKARLVYYDGKTL